MLLSAYNLPIPSALLCRKYHRGFALRSSRFPSALSQCISSGTKEEKQNGKHIPMCRGHAKGRHMQNGYQKSAKFEFTGSEAHTIKVYSLYDNPEMC